MLAVDALHFSFGAKDLLRDLSFSIAEGEVVALIGLSGSGKTTLFRLITGLLAPTKGSIHIGGEPLPAGSRLVTYMRQQDLLLPWRTVLENLLLFAELGSSPCKSTALRARACALLEQVGLIGVENAYPHELSGGMKQRVSLARALLQQRPLVLLDEPFTSLDVVLREQLYLLLRSIRTQYQKTVVMVTHDFHDALAMADRILILSQGRIAHHYALSPTLRHDPHATHALIQTIRTHLSA